MWVGARAKNHWQVGVALCGMDRALFAGYGVWQPAEFKRVVAKCGGVCAVHAFGGRKLLFVAAMVFAGKRGSVCFGVCMFARWGILRAAYSTFGVLLVCGLFHYVGSKLAGCTIGGSCVHKHILCNLFNHAKWHF